MNRKKERKIQREKNTNDLKYMKKWFSLDIKGTGCMKYHVFVHEIEKTLEKEGYYPVFLGD